MCCSRALHVTGGKFKHVVYVLMTSSACLDSQGHEVIWEELSLRINVTRLHHDTSPCMYISYSIPYVYKHIMWLIALAVLVAVLIWSVLFGIVYLICSSCASDDKLTEANVC
jgi:hypothetical protein